MDGLSDHACISASSLLSAAFDSLSAASLPISTPHGHCGIHPEHGGLFEGVGHIVAEIGLSGECMVGN